MSGPAKVDPDGKTDEEKDGGLSAPLSEVFRFATAFDFLCMFVGFVGMGAVGAAQPAMMQLFGDLMDVMGLQEAGATMENSFNEIAVKMTILGAICFVCAWMGDAAWQITGLRQSSMWRRMYLQAIIRQDVGWYDVNNPGELPTKIAECTQQIEEGIGPKLGLGTRMLMQGVFGMGFAFWYSWKMALVLMAISPVPMFGAWYFSYSSTSAAAETSEAYGKAGGTASESLSELRTIAALGIEERQAEKYMGSLVWAQKAGVRKSYRCGFANGLLFASGNLMAASGFLFGASLIRDRLKQTWNADAIPYDSDGIGGFIARLGPDQTGLQGANCMTKGDNSQIPDCGLSGGKLMIAMFAIQ
jgi:ATP-binding cassette subfamily B (MDR/TAP) protein 1